MGLDPAVERHQREGGGADLIGERRSAERHALASEAVSLAVERLVLPVLLEQEHGEEAGACPPTRHDVERRWRLRNLLAVPAGDLLAHGLDDLPGARDHLERLCDILAERGQAAAAAGRASAGCGDDDPLARQVLGERPPGWLFALERGD